MDGRQDFVGGVRIRPVLQELIKKCSGGMAAVSSAILLFAIHDGKSPGLAELAMLSMHAFSIQCLIGVNVFYGVFDGYESISWRADALLERLLSLGFGISMSGYFMLVWIFNRWLLLALLCGCAYALYQMRGMVKEVDSPHMRRLP